jgi:hypothetical protein
MPFFYEPPKCQFRGCFSHYYSPSNTFHCRVFLPAIILLVGLIGTTIGCGLYYRDHLSTIPQERIRICNTTQWNVVSLVNDPSVVQLNLTVHLSDHQCPQWSNLLLFECAIDDFYCFLSAKNQVINSEWPCVMRTLDGHTIDCSVPPTLNFTDVLTPSKILTGWLICLIFFWILCAMGMWFTNCNRGSDVPSMQPLLQ